MDHSMTTRICASPWCNNVLVRKKGEKLSRFLVRKTCDRSCGTTLNRPLSPNGTWTPERCAELQRGLDAGLSFQAIADGMGLTKDQCIGKAHRDHLKPTADAPLSQAQRAQREAAIPITTLVGRLDALNIFPPHGCCLFPIGDVGKPDFHFCGESVPSIGAPYCREHLRVTYLKSRHLVAPDALRSLVGCSAGDVAEVA
jgi:hypothetical protein